jgi:predicted TIM-barrel fold metal-dependent hydrolase
MQDDIFVIDGVAHSFDMSESNFADPRYAAPINRLIGELFASQPPGYDLDASATYKDWPIEDTANIMFRESYTDVAIFHPVPIFFYKDGLSGFHKAVEATKRWPQRFVGSYCAVDPLRPDPLGEFERQFEQLEHPVGLKLYPVGYSESTVSPWRMDDPAIGFPLYEKARELGLTSVAVHKSLPLGPAPHGDAFRTADIEGAAQGFPDINFSIVHGGISFTEETAWLLSRFSNIWINLETLNMILAARPRTFAEILAGLISVGGEEVIDRIYWGSGAMNCHPRIGLELFTQFEFPAEIVEGSGTFFPVPQLTHEHKRMILGGNIARLHDLDIPALAARIEDDEFSTTRERELPIPYSTTTVAGHTITPFPSSPE